MALLNTDSTRIILASKSPRRIELLKRIITKFEVKVSKVKEDENSVENPSDFVMRMSRIKAEDVASEVEDGIIIGADSVVVLDRKILGKPKNPEHAFEMLSSLSGKIHSVYTGFTITEKKKNITITRFDVTEVKFRNLEEWEIGRYLKVGKPFDKAGSYGIQDEAAVFVESITGCFYNVMGLPLTKLFIALKPFLIHS